MLSRELEETLRRAMSAASSHNHEFATLEHLLLALTEDSDAIEVWRDPLEMFGEYRTHRCRAEASVSPAFAAQGFC